MLKPIAPIAFFLAAALGAVALPSSALPREERPDCPGKMVCPLTGELVCKDRCPLDIEEGPAGRFCCVGKLDASRADCPGRIACPLTGEPVCRDRCPPGSARAGREAAGVLPCCAWPN